MSDDLEWEDDEPTFAWVGRTEGYEPVHSAITGTVWARDRVPDGWQRAASPAEAVVGADFIFLIAEGDEAADLLSRGILTGAPAGSCVVLIGPLPDEVRDLASRLEAAGLAALDLALLGNPARVSVGGERDTFNLLRPHLAPRAFFCGVHGAGTLAAMGERALLARTESDRLGGLEALLANAERSGAYPQALRNVWKAGPVSSPAFDAEADRLTKRQNLTS